jgi:hypothetical protein
MSAPHVTGGVALLLARGVAASDVADSLRVNGSRDVSGRFGSPDVLLFVGSGPALPETAAGQEPPSVWFRFWVLTAGIGLKGVHRRSSLELPQGSASPPSVPNCRSKQGETNVASDDQARAAAAVDQERLWQRHMAMAEIGTIAGDGVNRQALSAWRFLPAEPLRLSCIIPVAWA